MLTADIFENDLIKLAKQFLSARDGQAMLASCAGELSRMGKFEQVSFRIPRLSRLASTPGNSGKQEKVDLEVSFSIDQSDKTVKSRKTDNTVMIPIEFEGSTIGEATLVPANSRVLNSQELRHYRRIIDLFGHIYMNVSQIDRLKHLSIHDELTKCFNRRYLNECLESAIEWASRYKRTFSLLMLDLDNFKAINDSHGHLIGDEILALVGEMIQEEIRSSDLAFRFGGDEFAVILPETRIEGAHSLGDRLNESLQVHKKSLAPKALKLGISHGVGAFSIHGRTSKELIAAADHACLAAKRTPN